MSSETYVSLPGQAGRDDWLRWNQWIPTPDQMIAALRFQVADALDPYERKQVTVSMRQGIGMIAVLGLAAGFIPFLVNLWLSLAMGTSVPLALAANIASQVNQAFSGNTAVEIVSSAVQTLAGLEPRMPGFLAALLSALGIWLNWPIGWLSAWIIFGALSAALARWMGAQNMLQPFFAATAFSAAPLLLWGLYPVPIVGPLALLTGAVWGFLLYYRMVRFVTGLDVGRTLLCMLGPLALIVILPAALTVFSSILFLR